MLLRRYILFFAVGCMWLWTAGCGSDVKVETLERLPCVRSLTIVKHDPLRIRVVTSPGAGGVFIRKPNRPKTIHSSVDVTVGKTFVVHEGQTGYDFTLEGMEDGLIKFSTAVVENCGVPQMKVHLVKPYTKRK